MNILASVVSGPGEQASQKPLEHIRAYTLERVRHFLSAPKVEVYQDLKGMCDGVSASYRDRVITELLQNAHDAHPADRSDGRIYFLLDPEEGPFGTLYVANDGDGFSGANFEALCSPTRTTKNVNEAIGNKGVGFLSVFQVSAHPEVYSRSHPASRTFDGYCFSFSDDEAVRRFLDEESLAGSASLVLANMPRLYLACPAPAPPPAVEALSKSDFATVVRLPLKNLDAFSAVQQQLALLANEDPPMQLFLTRIRELTVAATPHAEPTILFRSAEQRFAAPELTLWQVDCGARTYLVAQRIIPEADVLAVIERDLAEETLPQGWAKWTGNATVSLAVATDGAPLVPRLYNFLPMAVAARAPFAGYLDAPFLATLNRTAVQPGVQLNAMLWEVARDLALVAAQSVRSCFPRLTAATAAIDFAIWLDEQERMRARLLDSGVDLIPTLSESGRATGWASLRDARLWSGDEVLTSVLAARWAPYPLVDDAIGVERTRMLLNFTRTSGLLSCTAHEQGEIVEGIAKGMAASGRTVVHWDRFYRSLTLLFRESPEALAGRRLLLDGRGELREAEGGDKRAGGRRRRKLRAMFLPPVRASSTSPTPALPKAVQARLSFLHPGLALAKDPASPVRRFFLSANLVREHESREILRMLANAIAEPGEARDPEALRWEALTAMMHMVIDENTSDGVVAEINPHVPTNDGWSRASTALFSRWPDTNGGHLERLFEEAAGLSPDLDEQRRRQLRPYADWSVPAGHRTEWCVFLRKAGVVDQLRPVPAVAGPIPREWPSKLQTVLVERSALPPEQLAQWRGLLPNPWSITNPQTDYTATGLYRLPGQLEFDSFGPGLVTLYAEAVVRLLEARPDIVAMTVYRPGYPAKPNHHTWPSPIAAFLRSARWMPLADGRTALLGEAWLPGENRNPPPLLPLVSPEMRRALAPCAKAAEVLLQSGLHEYGNNEAAWRFLVAAGKLVTNEVAGPDAERLFSATHDAWLLADLSRAPPAGLRLLGRRGGRVVAIDPRAADVSLLVADGDDRQLLAARARADFAAVFIEPPAARAKMIAAYLAERFPATVKRASEIEARYEADGEILESNADDPTIEDRFGDGVRQLLALTLRYRASFYRGTLEETLARLAQVRVRLLPALNVRVGDLSEPVPRFHQRAVVMTGTAGPTILCSDQLARSEQLLVGLAPAVASAIGAPNTLGEPLLAFAAELGARGLTASFEDYAAVLGVPLIEIKSVLGAARASVRKLLQTLRPLVAYLTDTGQAEQFSSGGGLLSEEDVVAALTLLETSLPEPPEDFVRRCRDAVGITAVAVALRLDLKRLNRILVAMDEPPIDLTDRHQAVLANYLARQEGMIRESIRATFRPVFEAGQDLAAYVAARDAPRPELPPEFGFAEIELTTGDLQTMLADWMSAHGVKPLDDPVRVRQQRDAVREANLALLRRLLPDMRVAILARSGEHEPLRESYYQLPALEAVAVSGAIAGGWADFDRLDRDAILRWLAAAGFWPKEWPSLAALKITDDERARQIQLDEVDRVNASAVKRKMAYSGGEFTFGVDALGSLADHIVGLTASNAPLLATSARTLKGTAPLIRKRPGGGSPGGGGGTGRMSEEERHLIGFFGEAIAFEWLKHRFGRNRTVDESCWRSAYREQVYGGSGDDGLGFDFSVKNGETTWYFEVKSTVKPHPLEVQSLELGPTEFERAEECRADRSERFRILYVTNALVPEQARIFMLPNPRSREGRSFFTDVSVGRRLYFPLAT